MMCYQMQMLKQTAIFEYFLSISCKMILCKYFAKINDLRVPWQGNIEWGCYENNTRWTFIKIYDDNCSKMV